MIKYLIFFVFISACAWPLFRTQNSEHAQKPTMDDKPKICFTFDDGQTNDIGEYKLEQWNELLLHHLKKHNLRAILFSAGANKTTEKGRYVLQSWNDAGHSIGNHSIAHKNFNNENTSLDFFKSELIKNDSIIRKYSNYLPYFRFPYLK